MKFIGDGIPGVHAEQLAGKLIVIEGADGSGRSTQIELLRNHLENLGHATVNVGLRRSFLVADELQKAKEGNILGEITRSLFYATDFADQLENRIIPALKAGFLVLADRYIYTLMARDLVRGADSEWLRSLYGIALVPDLVIYLKVSPAQLVERNLAKKSTLDYWESGMDLGLSRDSFDSFIRYQKLIQREFTELQQQYNFSVINGNLSVRTIAHEISSLVAEIL